VGVYKVCGEVPRKLICNLLSFRYSGEFREVGLHIDEIANLIWENVSLLIIVLILSPLFGFIEFDIVKDDVLYYFNITTIDNKPIIYYYKTHFIFCDILVGHSKNFELYCVVLLTLIATSLASSKFQVFHF
jgi:hypothetical protein